MTSRLSTVLIVINMSQMEWETVIHSTRHLSSGLPFEMMPRIRVECRSLGYLTCCLIQAVLDGKYHCAGLRAN